MLRNPARHEKKRRKGRSVITLSEVVHTLMLVSSAAVFLSSWRKEPKTARGLRPFSLIAYTAYLHGIRARIRSRRDPCSETKYSAPIKGWTGRSPSRGAVRGALPGSKGSALGRRSLADRSKRLQCKATRLRAKECTRSYMTEPEAAVNAAMWPFSTVCHPVICASTSLPLP